jgi:hypothetical protein
MPSSMLFPFTTKVNWEGWQLKDAVLFIPAAATLLAVSYDVGYFVEIDLQFFTFFSLGEHIVFALMVLPLVLALLFVTLLIIALAQAVVGWLDRILLPILPPKPQPTPPDWKRPSTWIALFVLLTLMALLLGYVIYLATVTQLGAPLVGGLVFALCVVAVRTQSLFVWVLVARGVFAVAVVLGSDFSRMHRAGGNPKNLIVDGQGVRGEIVRSGERGVLFYDSEAKAYRMVRWTDLKEIGTRTGTN